MPIYFKKTIIVKATAIFAPEDIPNTKGPAIGFEKNVCSKKPDNDNAPPSNAAINILGNRIFHIILYSTASPSLKNKIFKIFATEICTFPVLIFNTTIIKKRIAIVINTIVYLERLFKFSI